jgi:hypothetical protein
MRRMSMARISLALLLVAAVSSRNETLAENGAPAVDGAAAAGEWRHYGADRASSRYSAS